MMSNTVLSQTMAQLTGTGFVICLRTVELLSTRLKRSLGSRSIRS